MTNTLRSAAALYAEAALHEDIADQFSGTGEAWADQMVLHYRRDSLICLMQAVLTQRLAGVA